MDPYNQILNFLNIKSAQENFIDPLINYKFDYNNLEINLVNILFYNCTSYQSLLQFNRINKISIQIINSKLITCKLCSGSLLNLDYIETIELLSIDSTFCASESQNGGVI